MKKLLIMLVLGLMLVGCTSGNKEKGSAKIGIIKWADHPSLDESVTGFIETLDKDVVVIEKSAQGDMSTASMILKQFVDEKVDLVYAVATPAAQLALQETNLPVIFSAVTDPVEAKLLSDDRIVVGVSDEPALNDQMKLIRTLMPNAENVGVIFNTSEANSVGQMEDVRKVAAEFNLNIVEKGISEQNEVGLAAESLVSKIDAMFIINDNLVVSAAAQVTGISNKNNVPVFMAESGQFDQGGFATISVSYLNMGREAGKMVPAILKGETPSEKVLYGKNMELKLFLNRELAEKFKIDVPTDLVISNDN